MPTIIEAAKALYNNHSVADITRSDATARNLSTTSEAISEIIEEARQKKQKSICFVTGVPGAGKTLVGLNIATQHIEKSSALYSVLPLHPGCRGPFHGTGIAVSGNACPELFSGVPDTQGKVKP